MQTSELPNPASTAELPRGPSDVYVADPPARLSAELVREFSRISTARFAAHLLLEFGLIAGSIWLCERFWHPALYILTVIWIGARQHALMILMHDAAHYRAATNRKLNDVLGLIAGTPLFISLHAYRHEHFAHHRHVNTDDDPQWVDRDGPEWVFPKSRMGLAALLVGDLFGLGSYATVRYVLLLQKRLHAHGASLWLVALQPLLTCAIIAAVAITGTWLPFTLYWVIPIATWLTLILRIRSIAEHYALPHDHVLNFTRTVIPTWFEKLFVAPKSIALHLEHHQYPSVPFFRLNALHKALMEQKEFREQSHITAGYTGVFRECLQFTNTRPPRA